ncbi:Fatty acyl-CoA reductase 2 [Capsicum annuum]|uniref:Fatty acyl-CoA reductase n=1 Tax=Capsicum annuum TaxID=4072 RepID=A0A2G2YNL5_CAPAN|nr:Fatty acyl-CoA reductase 2 [Capsicum annuum]KAF3683163.1 Fatty acyl-CoA reductase 2 [Capsicum annuum]PHT71343.1 Fatty acyl-CoA reductase 2 [Capsicum annuum]
MEALCSLSSSNVSKNILKLSSNRGRCPLKKINNVIYCQSSSGNNAVKASKLSAVVTERTSTISTDNSSNDLRFSPNGNGIGIIKFLRGKTFLITGATGFLGKVLIEKILRTVPDVNKIFVLIKADNKEVAMHRLKNEVLNADIFKNLKQVHGKSYYTFMLSKLVPVVGNVSETNLGLDKDLTNVIAKEVDVIVNSAANTTFDERQVNRSVTKKSYMKHYREITVCFILLPTAYVNGQRQGRIMEKPFCSGDSITKETLSAGVHKNSFSSLNVEDEIKLILESKHAIEDNIVSQKMKELGLERANKFGWQDTYVFTKAMGEMMIDKMRSDVPVVIIRPSVIESTYREPFSGWMEGNRMMDPIILHYGKGQLTGFLVDPNGVLDVVPADMVVNATLAAIAKHGAAGKPGSNVYQVASSVVNPLVFKDLATLLFDHFNSSPYIDSKGRPIHVPRMKLFSSREELSFHLWRDAINKSGLTDTADPNGKLSRKLENICRKSVEQAKYLAHIYEPYTFYGGRFDNSNTQRMMECMSKEEISQFGFDVENIDWKDYISNVHIPGLRKHVMKGRGLSSSSS